MTNASKECFICHYCYFLDKEFRFQLAACNSCHNELISIDLNSINLNIHDADYCCIINEISKLSHKFIKNANLNEKSGRL